MQHNQRVVTTNFSGIWDCIVLISHIIYRTVKTVTGWCCGTVSWGIKRLIKEITWYMILPFHSLAVFPLQWEKIKANRREDFRIVCKVMFPPKYKCTTRRSQMSSHFLIVRCMTSLVTRSKSSQKSFNGLAFFLMCIITYDELTRFLGQNKFTSSRLLSLFIHL